MTKTLEVAESISDMYVENAVLGKEISKLKKMIGLGFEGKTIGSDKVAKILGSEDSESIAKLYDTIGGLIKSVKTEGSLDKLITYLNINHSITLDCTATPSYNRLPKKKSKYNDLFNEYFLESPTNPETDMKRIMNSLSANYKEAKVEDLKVKEEIEAQLENITDTEETLKTLTKMLTRSKLKDIEVSDVVSELESKMAEQEIAINLLTTGVEEE